MRKGFIACNLTTYDEGIEVFGVYSNEKMAERQLRKVVRKRFGRCPRDVLKINEMPEICGEGDYGDSYGVLAFVENDGEEYE